MKPFVMLLVDNTDPWFGFMSSVFEYRLKEMDVKYLTSTKTKAPVFEFDPEEVTHVIQCVPSKELTTIPERYTNIAVTNYRKSKYDYSYSLVDFVVETSGTYSVINPYINNPEIKKRAALKAGSITSKIGIAGQPVFYCVVRDSNQYRTEEVLFELQKIKDSRKREFIVEALVVVISETADAEFVKKRFTDLKQELEIDCYIVFVENQNETDIALFHFGFTEFEDKNWFGYSYDNFIYNREVVSSQEFVDLINYNTNFRSAGNDNIKTFVEQIKNGVNFKTSIF